MREGAGGLLLLVGGAAGLRGRHCTQLGAQRRSRLGGMHGALALHLTARCPLPCRPPLGQVEFLPAAALTPEELERQREAAELAAKSTRCAGAAAGALLRGRPATAMGGRLRRRAVAFASATERQDASPLGLLVLSPCSTVGFEVDGQPAAFDLLFRSSLKTNGGHMFDVTVTFQVGLLPGSLSASLACFGGRLPQGCFAAAAEARGRPAGARPCNAGTAVVPPAPQTALCLASACLP